MNKELKSQKSPSNGTNSNMCHPTKHRQKIGDPTIIEKLWHDTAGTQHN